MKYFNRQDIYFKPLKERKNKVVIENDIIKLDREIKLSDYANNTIIEIAKKIRQARENNKPVIMAFGAHSIKNGLASVMIKLINENIITHLATNGAGIIHDWEFSYLGQSSEDVKENVSKGEFGIWEDTGLYLNLAIVNGAYNDLGYGESVGRFIEEDGCTIESIEKLKKTVIENIDINPIKSSATLSLIDRIKKLNLKEGRLNIEHKYKKYSIQREAYKLNIPFTAHPMFGHDIIYAHPMNSGASIGIAAERDFLRFAQSVSELEGGVYLSIGSAVMSPMIFEKSLSMARNVAIQNGKNIKDFSIYVVDLQESTWDWSKGEPPMDNPAYYLRYMKTFSRMGGNVKYIEANNIDFLLGLYKEVKS